ncbi:uncharacterized protein LOC135096728 isoform X3 [Scylla paramamosain]|uniref:uncharacterized protein LOC135096728 isoform X3 n=1 Tax=Scylla paramamosain TaxID=85552 RepID=UPI0030835F5D
MVSPPSVLVLARPSSPRRPKRRGRCSTRPSSPPGSVRPGRGSSARSASPASPASGGTRTHSRSPSKPSHRTSGTAASLSTSSRRHTPGRLQDPSDTQVILQPQGKQHAASELEWLEPEDGGVRPGS